MILLVFQRTISSYDITGVTAQDSSRTWITFPTGEPSLTIEELHLKNGAHVALQPNPSAHVKHDLETQTMIGDGFIVNKDKLGVLHVGPHQKITIRYISLKLYMSIELFAC